MVAGYIRANVHVIYGMSNAGQLQYEIKRRKGVFRSEKACEWMRNCLRTTRKVFAEPAW